MITCLMALCVQMVVQLYLHGVKLYDEFLYLQYLMARHSNYNFSGVVGPFLCNSIKKILILYCCVCLPAQPG